MQPSRPQEHARHSPASDNRHKAAMSPRERLLASLRGRETDRLAWSPNLAYWWEAQPEAFRLQGDVAFLQSIGADPLLRGAVQLHRLETPGVELSESERDGRRRTEYRTPVGTLVQEHRYVANGNTWFLTEHPVKTVEDLKVLQWMNEHMRVLPAPDAYRTARGKLGDQGLIVPLIGTYGKSSFQSLIEHWVGTEELTWMLADDPDPVEACLVAMRERTADIVRIAAESEVEACIFWEDSSTQNITPDWFTRHTAPETAHWASMLHRHGKLLIHHACGHLRALLARMADTGIDVIESISPPPTGNIELWEARELLPPHVVLIGGIEPTTFLHSTPEMLDAHVSTLLRRMGATGWILANSDSCPPGVSLGKFRQVSRMLGVLPES